LLLPGLMLGAGSVVYWHWYDDLRLYAWVQYAPLLILPALLALSGPVLGQVHVAHCPCVLSPSQALRVL
jgi:hypothetical protein